MLSSLIYRVSLVPDRSGGVVGSWRGLKCVSCGELQGKYFFVAGSNGGVAGSVVVFLSLYVPVLLASSHGLTVGGGYHLDRLNCLRVSIGKMLAINMRLVAGSSDRNGLPLRPQSIGGTHDLHGDRVGLWRVFLRRGGEI